MSNNYAITLQDLSDKEAVKANVAYTEKLALFEESIRQATSGEGIFDTPKKNKISALNAIFSKGLDDLEPVQLMSLFNAYREINQPAKMIEIFEKCGNEAFTSAPMVQEQLAIAYRNQANLTPRQTKDSTPQEQEAKKRALYEKSLKTSQKLIDNKQASGLCYENISRTKRLMSQNLPSLTEEQKKAYEQESVKIAEEGFKETLETTVGMQAVHGNLALGNNDKAKEIANVVYLAALRDGAEESKDPFVIFTALQAACIAGKSEKEIQGLSNRLLHNLEYKVQANSFMQDLKSIQEFVPETQLKSLKKRLSAYQDKPPLTHKQKKKEENKKKKDQADYDRTQREKATRTDGANIDYLENAIGDENASNQAKLDALVGYSYNYRGCGSEFRGESRVGGNMVLGGQLPDHSISRKDLELFAGLMKMSPTDLGLTPEDIKFERHNLGEDAKQAFNPDLPLTAIKDPEVFMAVTDAFVRKTFMTENFSELGLHMENNATSKGLKNDQDKGESIYDRTVRSGIEAAGKVIDKNPAVDTKTSIAAIFALGMGDCRHHAQAKQIMFDVWQKEEMNAQLKQMCDRAVDGPSNPQEDKKNQDAFFEVLDTQLRTTDVKILLPIEMQEWKDKYGFQRDDTYNPKTKDNKYIHDELGRLRNLEDHTMCWIIKKDREGNLTGVGIRDAFYQEEHYTLAAHDVDVSKVTVTKDGKPHLPVGYIEESRADIGKPLQIHITPLIYNKGKRDTTVSNTVGNSLSFVGIPIEGINTTEDFLKQIQDREGACKIMQAMRSNTTGISAEQEKEILQDPSKEKAILEQIAQERAKEEARKKAEANKAAHRSTAVDKSPPKPKANLMGKLSSQESAQTSAPKKASLQANLSQRTQPQEPAQTQTAQQPQMSPSQMLKNKAAQRD